MYAKQSSELGQKTHGFTIKKKKVKKVWRGVGFSEVAFSDSQGMDTEKVESHIS
jgi:hypothetical protein